MKQFTKEVPELFIGMKGKTRLGERVYLMLFSGDSLVWFSPDGEPFITYHDGRQYRDKQDGYDIVEWQVKDEYDVEQEEKNDAETKCNIGSKEPSASINKIYITQQVGEATLHINIESNEPLIELVCAAATLLNQE